MAMASKGNLASHPTHLHARADTSPKTPKIIQTDASGHVSTTFDVGALDGLRVVASFIVIAFHCLLYWGALLPLDKGQKELGRSLPLRLAMHGNVGVDIFLVLTGMWATIHLVPALELSSLFPGNSGHDRTWRAIKRYFHKRVLRVVPPYLTALLLVVLTIDHTKNADPALRRNHDTVFEYCPQSLPLNFVYFWSLAVQLHFYLVFPFMLWLASPSTPGFRRRVALGSASVFWLTTLLRFGIAHAVGVRLPLPPFSHPDLIPESADVAIRYYHSLYFPTPARAVNLATGVLLGLLMLNGNALAALKKRRWLVFLASIGVFMTFGRLVLGTKLYGTVKEQRQWQHAQAFAAFAYHGSPLYSITAAAIILCTGLHIGPLFSVAAGVLASPPIRHLAKISYDMYLLHMPALYWWEAHTLQRGALEAKVGADPLGGYAIILWGTCVAGYIVALVHHTVHARVYAALGEPTYELLNDRCALERPRPQISPTINPPAFKASNPVKMQLRKIILVLCAVTWAHSTLNVDAARLANMHLPDPSTADLGEQPIGTQSRRLAQKTSLDTQADQKIQLSKSGAMRRSRASRRLSAIEDTTVHQERLAFGDPAIPAQYPFAARIDSTILCSGALIHPRVVLTAAHCVTDEAGNWVSLDFIKVKLGATDQTQQVPVLMGVMPTYNASSKMGDIAVLLLSNASTATPVGLADAATVFDQVPTLSTVGWGQTEEGDFPVALQRVALPTMTNESCVAAHAPMGEMPEDHFCVGLDPGYKSSCPGDSGGPIMVENPGAAPVQVGIVSYGPAGYSCGGANNLDIVTSVKYWRTWIEDTLSIYNMRGSSSPARLNTLDAAICYSGPPVSTIPAVTPATAGACCDTCRDIPECNAWSWSAVTSNCTLFSTTNIKTPGQECISGFYTPSGGSVVAAPPPAPAPGGAVVETLPIYAPIVQVPAPAPTPASLSVQQQQIGDVAGQLLPTNPGAVVETIPIYGPFEPQDATAQATVENIPVEQDQVVGIAAEMLPEIPSVTTEPISNTVEPTSMPEAATVTVESVAPQQVVLDEEIQVDEDESSLLASMGETVAALESSLGLGPAPAPAPAPSPALMPVGVGESVSVSLEPQQPISAQISTAPEVTVGSGSEILPEIVVGPGQAGLQVVTRPLEVVPPQDQGQAGIATIQTIQG